MGWRTDPDYRPHASHVTMSLIPPIDLYPVVVRESRYCGVYEGGAWFAYSGYAFSSDAIGDDMACRSFWDSEDSLLYGRGDTPNGAVEDLIRRHELYAKEIDEQTIDIS